MEAVLRRYIVGHALLWDYVMEEAVRVEGAWVAQRLERAGVSGGHGDAGGVGNGCGAAGSQRFYPRFWRPLASARFRHSTTPLAV